MGLKNTDSRNLTASRIRGLRKARAELREENRFLSRQCRMLGVSEQLYRAKAMKSGQALWQISNFCHAVLQDSGLTGEDYVVEATYSN